MSLHLGHVLLNNGFSAFAEVPILHPVDPSNCHIDLLAMSPDHTWFLASEVKRLFHNQSLYSLVADVHRIRNFWINTKLTSEACGVDVVEAVGKCKRGFGLVSGMNWITKGSSLLAQYWDTDHVPQQGNAFDDAVAAVQGHRHRAIIREYRSGTYWLLSSFFEIAPANIPTGGNAHKTRSGMAAGNSAE